MHGTGHRERNIFDAVDAQRGLAELLGVVHLVEAFVFAFLKVDHMAG